MNRVKEKYQNEVVPALKAKYNYKSAMQVPKLKKVVLNMGVGEAVSNNKVMEFAEYSLTQISGQKPVQTKAKKAIANFKLREGQAIGCMVTLRGERMFAFLDRLFSIALPRERDFKGTPKRGFDGKGNYNLGLRGQIIFPEINIEKLDKERGLNVTFVTSAASNDECYDLLAGLGMPFRK